MVAVQADTIAGEEEERSIGRDIALVIVNWNGADETIACVRSLLAAGAAAGSIYVVDNGSEDDSLACLEQHLPAATVVLGSKANRGFAGGANLGIRRALADGAEWVLLINNDTRVAADFFSIMVAATHAYPAFTVFAPLILYHHAPEVIWSLGEKLIPGTLITRSTLKNRPLPQNLPALMPVDLLNGCCLLVHREVFRSIGLLDESYFMYGEDADFCWRARQRGYRMACVTAARIWHKVSWSTRSASPDARYWRTTSQIRFYRRAARGLQRPLMAGFATLRCFWLAVQDQMRGDSALVAATLRGWWDGWLSPLD